MRWDDWNAVAWLGRAAALDRDLLEFAIRANSGPRGGPAEYRYEYLLMVARRGPA